MTCYQGHPYPDRPAPGEDEREFYQSEGLAVVLGVVALFVGAWLWTKFRKDDGSHWR